MDGLEPCKHEAAFLAVCWVQSECVQALSYICQTETDHAWVGAMREGHPQSAKKMSEDEKKNVGDYE